VKDFKTAISMNLIRNCPVTVEDINNSEKIFGADIPSMKGKVTRKKPTPVVEDIIELPEELRMTQKHVTLCVDVMHVNSLTFLTTISRNLYYRSAQHIKTTSKAEFMKAFKTLFMMYHNAGFIIKNINADNAFKPLMEEMSKFNVRMNFTSAQEHVPEAENNIRRIKERVRATYHQLPYKHLCKALVIMIVMESAKKFNFFPARNGVSKYYSPRMILHKRNIDYEKHCKFALGEYVQAHTEPSPSNTNEERTIDCIYLRYIDNEQGGHQLLNLNTNKIIARRNLTRAVITKTIIQRVHDIAIMEGMTRGIKMHTSIPGVHEEVSSDEEEVTQDSDYDEMLPDEIYENMNTEMEDTFGTDGNEENVVDTFEIDEHVEEENENNDTENDGENNEQLEPSEEHENNDAENDEESEKVTTRGGRVVKPPSRYGFNNLQVRVKEYNIEEARVLVNIMQCMEQKFQFAQRYTINKSTMKFGNRARQAARSELQQLNKRMVFTPIHRKDITKEEMEKSMESLMFVTEKRDGTVKARACANGSAQREYIVREKAASPTVISESVFITSCIDARESRDVMTCDIPNAFVQTEIQNQEIGERIIMKIRGTLLEILVEMYPEKYSEYVVEEGGRRTLYVVMLKALYGMMMSSLLYYLKFREDLEGIGFLVNPYDPCVANRIVKDGQHTVIWHVDDLKSTHANSVVNDDFFSWLKKKYANDGVGEVKVTRGKRHQYLGMKLVFASGGKLKIDMVDYFDKMCREFPEELDGDTKYPWTEKLFAVDKNSDVLNTERKNSFHTHTMKTMYLAKRARPDILPAVIFLSSRVKKPTLQDWTKLRKMMNFIWRTKDEVITLECKNNEIITWYVDAAFAVHDDMKSHTGAVMTLGMGSVCSYSLKQKVNARSSTEAELIGVDDVVSKILWTRKFLKEQGLEIKQNIVFRDNTSSMKLEENGRMSAGKRTRHFDIKYFYISDLIKRKEIEIKYCPTGSMWADYMTKPLVGSPTYGTSALTKQQHAPPLL